MFRNEYTFVLILVLKHVHKLVTIYERNYFSTFNVQILYQCPNNISYITNNMEGEKLENLPFNCFAE